MGSSGLTLAVFAMALVAKLVGADGGPWPRTESGSADLAAFSAIITEVAASNSGVAPSGGRFEELAGQVWALAGRRVTALLTQRPGASPADVVAEIEALNAATSAAVNSAQLFRLIATAVPLGGEPPRAWAVGVEWYYSGTFFVVAVTPETSWRPAWSVQDFAGSVPALCNELERWVRLEPGWHDGPFSGRVLPLPPSRIGRPRFAVDAAARPSMGLACVAQVSAWEWTGREAVPIFFGWYDAAGGGPTAGVEGSAITVRAMHELKSTFVCGSCEEAPEDTWRLELTPDGVTDKGRVSEVEGLSLVDELVDRVCRGRDASALARRTVIRQLRSWLEPSPENGPVHCLGMLMAWHSTTTPTGVRLVLDTDCCERLTFEIEGRDPRARVVAVTRLSMPWPP